MEDLSTVKEWVKSARRIVFLGGAGISTRSGIPDFRSPEGLYAVRSEYGVSYETMLSHDYFFEHNKEFYDFFFKKMVYPSAKPNDAHIALADYEKNGHRIAILTQNIDGLHQDAGSKLVYELHGSVRRFYCLGCGDKFALEEVSKPIPHCPHCGHLLKPDVVLYGEPLDSDVIESSVNELRFADLLIVAGTSLNVYPAAGLIDYFISGKRILINLSSTPLDRLFDKVIHEDAGATLKEILS